MQVKTNVKAGTTKITSNHNEAQVRAAGRALKVQTGVKAGTPCPPPERKGRDKPNC
jgi:hypothetical protein